MIDVIDIYIADLGAVWQVLLILQVSFAQTAAADLFCTAFFVGYRCVEILLYWVALGSAGAKDAHLQPSTQYPCGRILTFWSLQFWTLSCTSFFIFLL